MKLYPTLKDHNMKYPKLSNGLLDLGMLMLIGGAGVALCGAGLGMISASSWVALLVFLLGCLSIAAAQHLSKITR